MNMKSMRSTNSALMLAIELTKDFTRLPMEDQYLTKLGKKKGLKTSVANPVKVGAISNICLQWLE